MESPILSKVLLFGGTGMLGRAWSALLESRGINFESPSEEDLDLSDFDALRKAITDSHSLVINCAAWTDVDGAEDHVEQAMRTNADAVGELAARCRDTGSELVHYSTDYIFDGRDPGLPLAVDHLPNPINVYGRSKLEGERLLRQSGARHLLIRTSWLYAPWGKNFVRTMVDLTAKKKELLVVDDQVGRPTSAEHLAATTLALIEQARQGVYHVTDGEACSWHGLATEIASRVNPKCKVNPCTTDAFPRPAPRPGYSVLDLSGTEAVLGPMPSWKRNLSDVLDQLLNANKTTSRSESSKSRKTKET